MSGKEKPITSKDFDIGRFAEMWGGEPRYSVVPAKDREDRFNVLDRKRRLYVDMFLTEERANTLCGKMNTPRKR